MTGDKWTQEDVYLMSAEDVVQCLTILEDRNNKQAKLLAEYEERIAWQTKCLIKGEHTIAALKAANSVLSKENAELDRKLEEQSDTILTLEAEIKAFSARRTSYWGE